MRQFIPFEDDWDALERLGPTLIPYHVGVPCQHDLSAPAKSLLGISAWPAPGSVCAQAKEEGGSVRPYTTE
jgi:hypothetical protein